MSRLSCYAEDPWKVKFIKLSKQTLPNSLKELSFNVRYTMFFGTVPIKLYGNKSVAKM